MLEAIDDPQVVPDAQSHTSTGAGLDKLPEKLWIKCSNSVYCTLFTPPDFERVDDIRVLLDEDAASIPSEPDFFFVCRDPSSPPSATGSTQWYAIKMHVWILLRCAPSLLSAAGGSDAKAILFGVISKQILQAIAVWLYHREHRRSSYISIPPLTAMQLPTDLGAEKMTFLAELYKVANRKNLNELAASALKEIRCLKISTSTMDEDMADDNDEASSVTYLATSIKGFQQAMKMAMYSMQGSIRKDLQEALLSVYVPEIVELCMLGPPGDQDEAERSSSPKPKVVEELIAALEQWCQDDGGFAKSLLRCITEQISRRYATCGGVDLDDID